MLDKLVDLLVQFIGWFKFWTVVHSYQRAVRLRFGHYRGTLGVGLHLQWPLNIDEVICESVVTDTTRTPVQSLTTADGIGVACSLVLTCRVTSVQKLLLQCEGKEQAMLDSSAGVLARHVTGAKWTDLTTDEFMATVHSEIAARAHDYGIKLLETAWCDLVQCGSVRLLGSPSPAPAA